MRITLEPTTSQFERSSEATQHRVVIEHPNDDLALDVVIELVSSALSAYGYTPESVREYLDPEYTGYIEREICVEEKDCSGDDVQEYPPEYYPDNGVEGLPV